MFSDCILIHHFISYVVHMLVAECLILVAALVVSNSSHGQWFAGCLFAGSWWWRPRWCWSSRRHHRSCCAAPKASEETCSSAATASVEKASSRLQRGTTSEKQTQLLQDLTSSTSHHHAQSQQLILSLMRQVACNRIPWSPSGTRWRPASSIRSGTSFLSPWRMSSTRQSFIALDVCWMLSSIWMTTSAWLLFSTWMHNCYGLSCIFHNLDDIGLLFWMRT